MAVDYPVSHFQLEPPPHLPGDLRREEYHGSPVFREVHHKRSLLKREEEESIAALHLRLDGIANSAASWHQEEDGREDDDQGEYHQHEREDTQSVVDLCEDVAYGDVGGSRETGRI